MSSKYPELSNKAIIFLMPSVTTYLCEAGFSVLVALKTKGRNALNIETDLHLKLMSIQIDMKSLTAAKQHYPSH